MSGETLKVREGKEGWLMKEQSNEELVDHSVMSWGPPKAEAGFPLVQRPKSLNFVRLAHSH